MFGGSLSAELEGVEGKNKAEIQGKRERILEQWLAPVTGDGAAASGQFADPAARA